VICGPTAAGKSALALRLAEVVGAGVISADSRQVYRGFDIGTAKPLPAEQARVPHRGIDLAEPTARVSAATWAEAVPGWMAEFERAGLRPMVVGGTGFYLRALVAPLFVAPDLDQNRRQALDHFFDTLPHEELRRWVSALDPPRSGLGPAQLRRAAETALLAGRRISDLHVDHARAPWVSARYLQVDPGRTLARDIESRVDRMLDAGWLEEVRVLAARIPDTAPAWTATGYDFLRDVVRGHRTLENARAQIVIRTRQYAKRQRTWFRNQLPADRTMILDPRDPAAFERALAWWREED
jgi:tRNA dimethylallyltransferase